MRISVFILILRRLFCFAGLTESGIIIDQGNNTLTYSPALNFNGDDSFGYTISDGKGGTDSATVFVKVNSVNNPLECTDVLFNTSISTDLDIDVDNDLLSTCTDEEFNPKTVHDLGPDRFDHLWPNVKSSEPSKAHYSFWEHEWTKHGTCTGLSQDEYFDTALKHFLPTPSFVRDNYGLEVSSSDLLKAYREDQSYNDGDTILVCSGGRYLSEVRICVAKDKHGSGSYRIECIDLVVEEGNCGSEITIPKFYIDEEEELELEIKVE